MKSIREQEILGQGGYSKLLLVIASTVIFGSESRGTHDSTLLTVQQEVMGRTTRLVPINTTDNTESEKNTEVHTYTDRHVDTQTAR
jgi:hypothetical protein